MWTAIRNQLVLWLGVIAACLVCWPAAPHLRDARGAMGPLISHAQPLLWGIVAVLTAVAVATAVACVVGRIINAVVGWFVLGAGLYGLDYRLETIQETAFAGRSLNVQSLETGLLGVLLFLAVWVVWKISGPLKDIHAMAGDNPPHPLLSADAVKGLLATAVAIPAIWLIARSPMKGQAICAAFAGGMVGGLFGRLASPHVQPLFIAVGPILLAAIAQFVSLRFMGPSLESAFVKGAVPPLNLVMPLDLASGALAGSAVGIGWAKSFLHHDDGESLA